MSTSSTSLTNLLEEINYSKYSQKYRVAPINRKERNQLLNEQLYSIYIEKDQKSHPFSLFVKRALDVLLAILGLLILMPALLVIAMLIYVTSPGPIFYKSLRIGKNRKPFYMYKFRTMVVNAEKQRQQLLEKNNLQGKLFKLKHDPRVTPLGAFLRKYSLDEFPQLINVIRGEMSIVGPRPYIPEESANFKAPYTLRFSVTPGLTGPWQANGRSDLDFQQLCELEFKYILNWSLLLDIVLVLKTIPSVLFSKGAY